MIYLQTLWKLASFQIFAEGFIRSQISKFWITPVIGKVELGVHSGVAQLCEQLGTYPRHKSPM